MKVMERMWMLLLQDIQEHLELSRMGDNRDINRAAALDKMRLLYRMIALA